MDSITQALLGATIAEAGFRRGLGGRAVVVGAVLGILPDLDIVTGFAGPWAAMKYHRGPTHSLIVLAIAAPLVGWLAWRWAQRRASPGQWIHLAFWVLLTHALLDWCTSYGTQLLWPLTDGRFTLDVVAIIDPLYTLPLLAALLLACVPRIRRVSRAFAVGALVVTTAYLGFGFVQMQRARSLAEVQLEHDGFEAAALRVCPLVMTNLVWHIAARDEHDNLRVGVVSTWAPREIRFHRLDASDNPLVRKALESEHGRLFAWFADDMVSARVVHEDPGESVILSDQRYGMVIDPTKSVFTARARFDADGLLVEVRQVRDNPDIDLRREFKAARRLFKGLPPDGEE